MIAIGFKLVFGAARVAVIAVFVVAFGTLAGAPLILLPLLVAESLGRKEICREPCKQRPMHRCRFVQGTSRRLLP
jgi:hypothetical protein